MKVRNKKSGEIQELTTDLQGGLIIEQDGEQIAEIESLAELNEEWEDAPEESVKPYWFVNDLDGEPMKCDLKNCGKSNFIEWGKHRKEIGNYFSSIAEAEKAVERLKAWKRLKDNGFTISQWRHTPDMNLTIGSFITIKGFIPEVVKNMKDLDLLFGGEE